MSKTDTCTKCGRVGHTASSCTRFQCVSCSGFRMTLKKALHACLHIKKAGWSPSPTFWRECERFRKVDPVTETKRRDALREMGSVTA